MSTALWIFCVQAALGAFDTLYYHEWRARLPAGGAATAPELRLHGVRSVVYALLFLSLPFVAYRGAFAAALAAVLAIEIVVTMCDFVVEDRIRAPLGGVFAGERVTHAVMAILYGAALSHLLPEMAVWWHAPTGLGPHAEPIPAVLQIVLPLGGAGVLVSGLRDLGAAFGLRFCAFPWKQTWPER